ncbi:MAG: hypothetical protein CMC13_16150 [Flavobacteriaceae bacterium]|nr:hypothetical protein [Flavobacteriaceae bacterium]
MFTKALSSSETIEVYGVRNTNGLPISINQMILRNISNEEIIYMLDESGKLDYLIANDGTVLKLDWQENLINLTVIGNSKESYFKTTVDLNNRSNTNSTSKQNSTKVLNQNSNENIQVNVKRCGELANYEGIVKVETDFGEYNITNKFSILRKSNVGVYIGQVDSPLLPPLTGEDVCSALPPLTEYICGAYGTDPSAGALGNAICVQIGAYISATGAVPVGIGVGALCAALNSFFSLACEFEEICNVAEFQDFSFTNQELPIRAVLSGPDGNLSSDWITVNFSQELPTLEVNIGDSYIHLVEITAPLLNCESDWEAYVDDINFGPISAEFPVFTTIPNGEHTIYLKNGVQYTENWNDPILFPCAGANENNISFDVKCESQTNISLDGYWFIVQPNGAPNNSSLTGTFTRFDCKTGENIGKDDYDFVQFNNFNFYPNDNVIEYIDFNNNWSGTYQLTAEGGLTFNIIIADEDDTGTMSFSGNFDFISSKFNGFFTIYKEHYCDSNPEQIEVISEFSGNVDMLR